MIAKTVETVEMVGIVEIIIAYIMLHLMLRAILIWKHIKDEEDIL